MNADREQHLLGQITECRSIEEMEGMRGVLREHGDITVELTHAFARHEKALRAKNK